MSKPIEIEHRLRAARPEVEGGPPPLAQVLERIHRSASSATERRLWRRWRRAPVALPALIGALLLSAGGAAAALLLAPGEPVAPAYVLPATPNTGLGEPVPASLALLPMRVSDPEGGPPWAMRAIRTSRGLLCLQGGRVVEGRLGGLGSGYAFHGDQRFHPFLADDAVATDACPAAGDGAGAFLPGPPVIVPANGLALAGENVKREDQLRCDLPGQADWGVRCPQQELRQVAMGLLGPHAQSIEVTTPQRSFAVAPYGPLGAYLIVLPAQPQANASMSSGGYEDPFGYASRAPGGATLTVTWDDGTRCQIPAAAAGQQCRAHAGTEATPSAAELAAPVQASYVPLARDAVRPLLVHDGSGAALPAPGASSAQGENAEPGPAIAVSFHAPVAIAGSASAYVVELRPHGDAGCQAPAVIVSQPTEQTLAKGAAVQITVALPGGSCASSYSGRVFFASSAGVGGESGGEGPLYEAIAGHFGPGAGRASLPTVGRFEVAVH